MIRNLKVTVLVENTARVPGTLGEHGISFFVEADAKKILFDTGQGRVLLANANALSLPLDEVTSIVLSHGHYDHTGGLPDAIAAAPHARLFLHPAALQAKFVRRSESQIIPNGMPAMSRESLDRHSVQPVWTNRVTEVWPGVRVTGEIPRRNDFETAGGSFFLDEEGRTPDPLLDDQALLIECTEGLVILLGCCHSGVANTLDRAAALSKVRPIFAVLGGMHLLGASEHRLEKTVKALRRHDVKMVGPGHCTGAPGSAYLWLHLPERVTECATGMTLELRAG